MRKSYLAILLASAATLSLCGCGSKESKTASVQSVSMLCGLSGSIQSQQFAGVVNTGKEQSINKDSSRKVAVVKVKKGDYVNEGDVLFSYDAEAAKNALEKAQLELEEQKNSLTAKEEERKQLEADKQKAAQKDQLDYTLKIQEMDTDIREANYNISLKEKDIKRLEESTQDLDVKAPFSGMIAQAGAADSASDSLDDDTDMSMDYSSGDDSSSAFIKIVETDNYRIKGTINEQNVNDIYNGMSMTIYSRLDPSKTWEGQITEIDLKNTESNQNNNYYYDYGGSDEMTTSSKYAFYVSIDDLDGLMVGQHVYMKESEEGDGEETIRLDASFINDAEGNPWIWAEGNDGLLEKRTISVDDYDASDNTWVVTEGIDTEDYVAPSDGSYEVGMTCIENNNSAFGSEQAENADFDDAAGDLEGQELDELGDEDINFDDEFAGFEDFEGDGEDENWDDGGVVG